MRQYVRARGKINKKMCCKCIRARDPYAPVGRRAPWLRIPALDAQDLKAHVSVVK